MNSWTLLRLNAQKQDRYIEHVSDNMPGVETYYPVYEKKTRPSGWPKSRQPLVVIRPVYPGYVFANLDIGGREVHMMISLPVRARFIKFGEEISTIPDRVISELRRLESLRLLVREIQRANPYIPGAKVRVNTPVASIEAIVISLLHGKRVRVDSAIGNIDVPIHQVSLV